MGTSGQERIRQVIYCRTRGETGLISAHYKNPYSMKENKFKQYLSINPTLRDMIKGIFQSKEVN